MGCRMTCAGGQAWGSGLDPLGQTVAAWMQVLVTVCFELAVSCMLLLSFVPFFLISSKPAASPARCVIANSPATIACP